MYNEAIQAIAEAAKFIVSMLHAGDYLEYSTLDNDVVVFFRSVTCVPGSLNPLRVECWSKANGIHWQAFLCDPEFFAASVE